MLLASLFGRQRGRARSALENPAKAKTVTVAKGQKGDAGAVFDLAPKSGLVVGPVSSKGQGDGGRKTGEEQLLHHFRFSGRDWRFSGLRLKHDKMLSVTILSLLGSAVTGSSVGR